jgi:hypothetical protein
VLDVTGCGEKAKGSNQECSGWIECGSIYKGKRKKERKKKMELIGEENQRMWVTLEAGGEEK